MAITSEFKIKLLSHCESLVSTKLGKIKHAIADIVESLESETKSTAGDKHETDRAMMDIEREQLGARLDVAEQQYQILKNIRQRDIKPSKNIHIGSLVKTTKAIYYIAVSVGAITLDNETVYVISKESPIGMLLMNKTEKDTFEFNGETMTIKIVY